MSLFHNSVIFFSFYTCCLLNSNKKKVLKMVIKIRCKCFYDPPAVLSVFPPKKRLAITRQLAVDTYDRHTMR